MRQKRSWLFSLLSDFKNAETCQPQGCQIIWSKSGQLGKKDGHLVGFWWASIIKVQKLVKIVYFEYFSLFFALCYNSCLERNKSSASIHLNSELYFTETEALTVCCSTTAPIGDAKEIFKIYRTFFKENRQKCIEKNIFPNFQKMGI
jgi:hypothetical protein